MNHFRIIVTHFLLVLLTTLALGHNGNLYSLHGTVVDVETGETLPGANIQLLPGSRGTASDQYGRFQINHIQRGTYELIVSFIGYESIRKSFHFNQETDQFTAISLSPVSIEAPELSVSAERDRQVRTVNLSQEVLQMRDLRMTSAIAEPDLFRSLSTLTGVVQANDFNSRFYIRGGRGNENHVLVDGVTIHNPYHALGFFSTFDVDAIKAVEIYRGIFPARYCERLSSVTNVILRDGNGQRVSGLACLSMATSKFLLEGPILKYNHKTGKKWTFMVNGRRTYIDRFTDFPFYFYDISGKTVYDSGHRTRLVFHGFYGMDRITSENDGTFPKIAWKNQALGIQWYQILSKKISLNSQISYSNFHSDATNLPEANQREDAPLEQRNRVVEKDIFTELNYQLHPLHEVTLGYSAAAYDIEQYLDNFFRKVFQGQWQNSLQQKMYLSATGMWFNGVVYELGLTGLHFSKRTRWELSPRFGLKFLVTDAWRIKAGLGRHFQTMTSLNDDEDILVLFDAWIPTPTDRALPRADHFGWGIEFTPNSIIQSDLELYYRKYANLTRFNRTQRAGEPFYLDGWAESFGMEFRFSLNWRKYYGFVNYAWSKATAHFLLRNQPMRHENDFRWQVFPADGDTRHALKFVIGTRLGRKWEISLNGILQTGQPYTAGLGEARKAVSVPTGTWPPYYRDPFEYGITDSDVIFSSLNAFRFPAYQRFDIMAAYHFTWLRLKWNLFIQIYNIFYRKNTAYHNSSVNQQHDERGFGLPFLPTFGLQARF